MFKEQQHAEAALAAKEKEIWKISTVEIHEDLLKTMKDDWDRMKKVSPGGIVNPEMKMDVKELPSSLTP